MIDCVLSLSNYDYQGDTMHSPYSTVFDYKCGWDKSANYNNLLMFTVLNGWVQRGWNNLLLFNSLIGHYDGLRLSPLKW